MTLPPGRGRLATKPLPTGSVTVAKMMGMVRVCSSNSAVVGVLCGKNQIGPQCDELLRESLPRTPHRTPPSECRSECCGPPSTRVSGVRPGMPPCGHVIANRSRQSPSAHRCAACAQPAAPARKTASDRRATKKRDELAPSHCLPRGSGQGIVSRQTSRLEGVGREDSQCPLWVKSRHMQCKKPCPLYPE